jgi:hypothetical protein
MTSEVVTQDRGSEEAVFLIEYLTSRRLAVCTGLDSEILKYIINVNE